MADDSKKRQLSLSPQDDFTRVSHKKTNRRRTSTLNDSHSSSTSHDSSASTDRQPSAPISPTFYTAHIDNIPARYANQKDLYRALSQLPNLVFHSLRLLPGNKATVKSQDPFLARKLAPLKNSLNQTTLLITPAQQPKLKTQNPAAISSPTFSLVVRSVDLNITPQDIQDTLTHLNLDFLRAWRIRSKATDQDTRFIRILTKSPSTLDRLLENGLPMFGRNYPCEPSRLPGPQPLQCGRCFSYGHPTSLCRQTPICSLCAGSHPSSSCTQQPPKPTCTNCKGEHLPYSQKCPQRPSTSQLNSPSKTAPVKCVDPPTQADKQRTEKTNIDDTIRFTYLCLVNLLPQHHDTITQVITRCAGHFFKRKITVSGTGTKLHVGISRLPTNP